MHTRLLILITNKTVDNTYWYIYWYIHLFINPSIHDMDTINIQLVIVIIAIYWTLKPQVPSASAILGLRSSQQLLLALQFHGLRGCGKRLGLSGKVGSSHTIPTHANMQKYMHVYVYVPIYIYISICLYIYISLSIYV